jgi:hypothetical protein
MCIEGWTDGDSKWECGGSRLATGKGGERWAMVNGGDSCRERQRHEAECLDGPWPRWAALRKPQRCPASVGAVDTRLRRDVSRSTRNDAESKRLPTMVSCRHGQSPPALFHDGTCLGSEQAQAHEDQPARHSHGHDKSNRAMATNEPLPLAPSPPSPH